MPKKLHEWRVGDVRYRYEDASIVQVETITDVKDAVDRYSVLWTRAVSYKKDIGSGKAGESFVSKHTESVAKYLCLGGPFTGMRLTEQMAQRAKAPGSYVRYNSSSPGTRAAYRQKTTIPSSVLVWLQ